MARPILSGKIPTDEEVIAAAEESLTSGQAAEKLGCSDWYVRKRLRLLEESGVVVQKTHMPLAYRTVASVKKEQV
jgi:predicted ArsR family transcriptional regulator